jgi:hypothetical protein
MTHHLRRFRWVALLPALLLLALGLSVPARAQDGPMPPAPANQPTPAAQPAPPPANQPPAAQPPAQQQPPDASSPAAPAQPNAPAAAAAASPATSSATAPGAKIEVPSGTHFPLVLHNAISTRSTRAGDPVYFETLSPVMVDGRVVIPAGTYVNGEVTESKRPGRVKGRGELMVKLNTMILPNGYMVNLNAVPSNAGTGGGETTTSEGKIIGDSHKAGDLGTVIETTAAGAGIGGVASRSAEGVGIGAGVGAAVGLATVLLTRGPDAEMPRGTTVEATLNRPVFLDSDRVQFTGPGQASPLAGPPDREAHRGRIFYPF